MELSSADRDAGPARSPDNDITRRGAILTVALLAVACRAAPIPESQRFPAGTPFHAHYVNIDSVKLRVIDTGRGTPVVFIHGIGASMYTWRKTLPVVAAGGYRVIAFDNLGFGFSSQPAHGYSNVAYIRLVTALLDSLRIGSAVLVGHAMGGEIAAEVALAHPERVRGVVLIDAAGYGVGWPGVLNIARWPFIGAIATAFRGRRITGRILKTEFLDPRKVTETDIDQYYAPVAAPSYGRALRGVLREFRFDTLAGRLGALQTPTLVVWGDADRWIPLRTGSRLAAELPRAAFVVMPRTGHTPVEESPEEFNAVLSDFLKAGLSRIPENVAWYTPSSRSSRSNSRSIPLTPQKSGS